jgi:hypothetical protein
MSDSIFETFKTLQKKTAEEKALSEKVDSQGVIKELIDTGWSKDNKSQMKAIQLLKGLALSDEPEANAFMKKLDSFTSGMKSKNEAKGKDVKVKVSDETMDLINKDKKKELKAKLDSFVKDIKSGVTHANL